MAKSSMRLWQHQQTGELLWSEAPGPDWREIPTIPEDELPAGMSDAVLQAWYDTSHASNGVRLGPAIIGVVGIVDIEQTRGDRNREFWFDLLRWSLMAAVLTAVLGAVANWLGE